MSALNLISLVFVLIAINCQLIASDQCSCPISIEEDELSSLKGVYILMRHGIRAPWTTYPLDPFANDTTRFPNGKSQLTDAGIEQAYNMGRFLKKRYGHFIKGKKKTAFLRASAAQRCIDTISIVAKKLWPPEVDDEKSWQPMIFSLPKQIDTVLYEEPDCEHAEEAEQNNLKTQVVKDYESDPKIQELYKFTAEKTGLPPDMYSVTKAFDCIRCEKLSGLPSPDWATPQIYERMGDVLSKRQDFFYNTTKPVRLRAGPILSDFKTQMDNIINSKPGDKPKTVFLYGTHDVKIAAMLNALGDRQPKYPAFASTIAFELHRIGDKNIVRAQFIDNTTKWPYTGIQLNLTKCKKQGATKSGLRSQISEVKKDVTKLVKEGLTKLPSLSLPNIPKPSAIFEDKDQECTFENFVDSIADLTPVDWRTECGIDCKYDPFKAAENNLGKT